MNCIQLESSLNDSKYPESIETSQKWKQGRICFAYAKTGECPYDNHNCIHISPNEYRRKRLSFEQNILQLSPENIIFLDGDNASGFIAQDLDILCSQKSVYVIAFFSINIWNTIALSNIRKVESEYLMLIPTITESKDAADHVLSSYVFRLDAIMNHSTKFIIVTSDKFSYEVVWQLRMLGRKAYNLNPRYTLSDLAKHNFDIEELIKTIHEKAKVFNDNTKNDSESSDVYVLNYKSCNAYIEYIGEDKYVIKSGALISVYEAPTLEPRIRRIRRVWREKGILERVKDNDEILVLKEDQTVSSINTAKKIVYGGKEGNRPKRVIKNVIRTEER
jgi:uncharacterized protein YsxB (DUF464 family)